MHVVGLLLALVIGAALGTATASCSIAIHYQGFPRLFRTSPQLWAKDLRSRFFSLCDCDINRLEKRDKDCLSGDG